MTRDEFNNKIMYVNRICPLCRSGNMSMLKTDYGFYKYKCMNCSAYFTKDDLYVGKHEKRMNR